MEPLVVFAKSVNSSVISAITEVKQAEGLASLLDYSTTGTVEGVSSCVLLNKA